MPRPRETIFRWPSWIEPGIVEGHSVTVTDTRLKSDFNLSSQFLVEFDSDETNVNCTLFLDSLQSNWFEAFDRDILRQGSRWFLIDLWIGGQIIEHRARFKTRPEANNRVGLEWMEYTFQLEIFKRQGLRRLPALPEGQLEKWPETMPIPITDSYGVKLQDRREVSEFDVGSLYRVKVTTDETLIPCKLYLTSEEANWFEAFERDVLAQGSRWFIMPLWVGGQMGDHTVRFATRPEASKEAGAYTTYSFELDVAKRQGLMDKDLVEWFIDNNPYDLILAIDLLQIIVNKRLPISLPYTN